MKASNAAGYGMGVCRFSERDLDMPRRRSAVPGQKRSLVGRGGLERKPARNTLKNAQMDAWTLKATGYGMGAPEFSEIDLDILIKEIARREISSSGGWLQSPLFSN